MKDENRKNVRKALTRQNWILRTTQWSGPPSPPTHWLVPVGTPFFVPPHPPLVLSFPEASQPMLLIKLQSRSALRSAAPCRHPLRRLDFFFKSISSEWGKKNKKKKIAQPGWNNFDTRRKRIFTRSEGRHAGKAKEWFKRNRRRSTIPFFGIDS